jgi:uncharacterized protein (TIGR00725 family)
MAAVLPIVGVMGSSRLPHAGRARPLGEWLAGRGVHLLTGGGGGVMAAVSEAFHGVSPRRGLVLGILPRHEERPGEPKRGYPNPWVELAIRTHLPYSGRRGRDPLSRNHINVLTADVIVALPGGPGTSSEVALALDYGQPVIAWMADASELPSGTRLAADLGEVTGFIDAHLSRG